MPQGREEKLDSAKVCSHIELHHENGNPVIQADIFNPTDSTMSVIFYSLMEIKNSEFIEDGLPPQQTRQICFPFPMVEGKAIPLDPAADNFCRKATWFNGILLLEPGPDEPIRGDFKFQFGDRVTIVKVSSGDYELSNLAPLPVPAEEFIDSFRIDAATLQQPLEWEAYRRNLSDWTIKAAAWQRRHGGGIHIAPPKNPGGPSKFEQDYVLESLHEEEERERYLDQRTDGR